MSAFLFLKFCIKRFLLSLYILLALSVGPARIVIFYFLAIETFRWKFGIAIKLDLGWKYSCHFQSNMDFVCTSDMFMRNRG